MWNTRWVNFTNLTVNSKTRLSEPSYLLHHRVNNKFFWPKTASVAASEGQQEAETRADLHDIRSCDGGCDAKLTLPMRADLKREPKPILSGISAHVHHMFTAVCVSMYAINPCCLSTASPAVGHCLRLQMRSFCLERL